jgi:hypothetical protein
MKGQTVLCQDSPMKRVENHNKIGRLLEENAIKHQKKKKKCHQTFIESHKKKKKKKSGFDTKEKRAKAENCINFQQSRYSVNISTSSGYTTDNCSQKLLVSE